MQERRIEMHHKRKRPKAQRAGCLCCKPWKRNGCCPRHLDMKMGNRRREESTRDQIRCEKVGD